MTLLGWMLYTALVGGLLVLAAWILERGAERLKLPLRWIWAGALALGVLVPIWALANPGAAEGGRDLSGTADSIWMSMAGTVADSPDPGSSFGAWGGGLATVMNRALQGAADVLGGARRVDTLLGWGWGTASVLFLGVLIGGKLSLERRRRRWISTRLAGREVFLAPAVGPAVVGLLQPRIVLPALCRDLGGEELHLILDHEEEHLRARDPLLLAACLVPLVLAPWNPAFWWGFRRLRAAMEVDCDRRVLARGARPAAYGGLLVRIGATSSHAAALPVLSLAGSHSTLERRLKAMKQSTSRNAVPVSIICAVLAVGVMVLACQADTPLAPDIAADAAQDTHDGVTAAQEASPSDEIPDAPHFTPFTAAPEITNRQEIGQALAAAYPTELREAGIGGTTIVHMYIDAAGQVGNVLVANPSGSEVLDQAALEVAREFAFEPARNRDEVVPVWIQIPITFQTR